MGIKHVLVDQTAIREKTNKPTKNADLIAFRARRTRNVHHVLFRRDKRVRVRAYIRGHRNMQSLNTQKKVHCDVIGLEKTELEE